MIYKDIKVAESLRNKKVFLTDLSKEDARIGQNTGRLSEAERKLPGVIEPGECKVEVIIRQPMKKKQLEIYEQSKHKSFKQKRVEEKKERSQKGKNIRINLPIPNQLLNSPSRKGFKFVKFGFSTICFRL